MPLKSGADKGDKNTSTKLTKSVKVNVLEKDRNTVIGASVVQWLVRWTLGRRARVQVLPGACRCILKQDALPTLLRLSDKT